MWRKYCQFADGSLRIEQKLGNLLAVFAKIAFLRNHILFKYVSLPLTSDVVGQV